MAFTALTTAQVASGQAVKTELFDLIRTNLDDLDTRLTSVEAGAASPFPILFEVFGKYSNFNAPKTGIMYHRANFDATLSGVVVMVQETGTAGTIDIDIQKKRGAGAFATIFSTRPTVAFGAGDFGTSTNAVLSDTDLDAGDILRLDVQGVQTGPDIDGFSVNVSYTL